MTSASTFHEELVRQLAQILKDTDLTEIEYEVEGCRIKVARKLPAQNVTAMAPMGMPTLGMPQQAAPLPQQAAAAATSTKALEDFTTVKSPMVGTVYLKPSPDAAVFVKVGDKVTKGQTLLIIEAMKVMNQIKAPVDGVVSNVFVENAEPVEFDQPLVAIS